MKQNIDSINPAATVNLINHVVLLLNYLSQANIEDTFLDTNINHLILPEEIHLRGMTVFSESKKCYGDYDSNTCTKNEVNRVKKKKTSFKLNLRSNLPIYLVER